MSTANEVIAGLEEAKRKLTDAKAKTLQSASILGRISNAVSHVLGRAGSGSSLLANFRLKERAIVEEGQHIAGLMTRVDAAIAQVRSASGLSPGPTPASGAA